MIKATYKEVKKEFWRIAKEVIPEEDWFRFVVCETIDGIAKTEFPKEYSKILAKLNKKFAFAGVEK